MYLQWSDLHSQPEACWSPQSFVLVNVLLGLGFLSVTVIRMAVRTSNEVEDGDLKPVPDSDAQVSAGVYYHLLMCAGTMYLSMLLTLWGSVQVQGQQLQFSQFSGWVSLALEWTTISLFFWSLLAPVCLPDRDFA